VGKKETKHEEMNRRKSPREAKVQSEACSAFVFPCHNICLSKQWGL